MGREALLMLPHLQYVKRKLRLSARAASPFCLTLRMVQNGGSDTTIAGKLRFFYFS
jgi:hypothetical protein